MNEIEKYLDQVCRTLGGSHELREHIREELREHLEEAVEAHVAKGLSRDEAAKKAIEEFGRPEDVGKDLESVYGRRMMSLAIDKAMKWKERTMKSGWKWSFVAIIALFCVVAAELALVLCIVVFVFPWIEQSYAQLHHRMPLIAQQTVVVARHLRNDGWAYFAVALAGWILFEWRCRTESKPVIRLAVGALVALVTTAAVYATTFATLMSLLEIQRLTHLQDPGEVARAAVAKADSALAEISRAVAAMKWLEADTADDNLQQALEDLRHNQPGSVPALVAMKRPQDAEEIRTLLGNVSEKNHDLRPFPSSGPYDAAKLTALRESWDAFRKEVPCELTGAAVPTTGDTETGGNP